MGQFRALAHKNWILFKRSWFGSLMQLLVPIAFVAFVFLIRNLAVITYYPETQFYGINMTYTIPDNNTMIPSMLKQCYQDYVAVVASNNPPLLSQVQTTLSEFGYVVKMFGSDDELNQYIRDPLYGTDSNHYQICFGITLVSDSPNYSYKLRYNISGLIGDNQGPNPQGSPTTDTFFEATTLYYPIKSGMLVINNMMHNLILRAQTSNNLESIRPVLAPMKQEAYQDDPLYSFLGNSLDMLCLLPLLIVYLRQISVMLTEKEKKIRETMKIMGMTGINYYLTWFLRYFAIYVVIHCISSYILYRTFTVVSYPIILLTFVLFDIVLVVQAFFIQVFFTRAKIGIVIGLLFFCLQFIVNFLVRNSDNPTYDQAVYGSISPHSAFISALREMLYCSSLYIPLGFNEVIKQINLYRIIVSWVSCAVHIVFWSILAYYLEQVFPNEWGAKQHPCFCFKWMCSQPQTNSKIYEQINESHLVSNDNVNIEQVEARFRQMQREKEVIKLVGVNKQFDNGKKAVRDLNLTIYNNQIFVLLGHNGAGKTTTISMLTGLLNPSSGSIHALGYDLSTDMDTLRQKMGICPQHDTLYDELTVQEHLKLFGTFRGFGSKDLKEQVNKLIKDVNLVEKTNYLAKELSGGQKRRLSVAMAFSGGSKLIFLDQPTSGMDTSARRYIWEMMKNYKNDRIIVLTTHFMDEADFLSDRVCIMSEGRLVCLGSTIFLKNRFGVGYNITVVKKDTKTSSQPIITLIKRYVPLSKVTTNVSSQMAMQLPMEEVDRFPKLFEQLDSKKKELGIESYGVSITTLEQVFLKVAEDRHREQSEQDEQLQVINSKKAVSPKKVIGSKKVIKSKNELVNNESVIASSQKGIDLSQKHDTSCKFFRHTKAILVKRFRVTYRDYKTLSFEFIFPIVIILAAMFLMRISFVTDILEKAISLDVFQSEGFPITIPVSGNDSVNNMTTLVNRLNTDYGSKINAMGYTASTVQQFDNQTLFPIKNGGQLKGGIFLPSSAVSTSYAPVFLINTRSPDTPLLLPTLFAQSLTNTLIASPITITPINSPLPRTYQNLQINNAVSGFLAAFIFSMALAFKFASIISFIVKEREQRCKHQQIVSGMSIHAYWFGNFLFDMLLYMMVAAFAAGMCMAFNVDSLTQGDAIYSTWIVFVLYGLCNIPFTYIASFLFTDYGNSQAIFYFWNFVAGGILPTIIIVLRFLGDNTAFIGRIIAWPLRPIPAFSFGESLLNAGSVTLLSLQQNDGVTYQIFDMSITLSQIIFLAGGIVLFWMVLFIIEALQNNQAFLRFFSKQSNVLQSEEGSAGDQDVLQEMVKAQMAKPQEYTILTQDLRKVYLLDGGKHKVAVDRLNFTVSRGEVFGLLGVNGAGKTTTFKMLAGEVTSTSGEAYFNGMKISDNLEQVRKNLGYCPQFDALLENLTVRQQLELYYDMKSLPSQMREQLIQLKIQELNLQKYRNVLSGTLSGGNKRKLSVACAIIGDPKIIFLDEPSTGMDPQARRFMWRVISNIATIRRQSTIILTTHSMEEAEALSTRLGIMVRGNFRCMGTPQHIKTKYGEGYELEIKVMVPSHESLIKMIRRGNMSEDGYAINDSLSNLLKILCKSEEIIKDVSMAGPGNYLLLKLKEQKRVSLLSLAEFICVEETGRQVHKFISEKLGGVEVLEHFQTFYRFKLKTGIPIGRIFGLFQENKQRLNIQQYSIKQATVEQIFNKFARQFEEIEEN